MWDRDKISRAFLISLGSFDPDEKTLCGLLKVGNVERNEF
jgi:hypothetical protein